MREGERGAVIYKGGDEGREGTVIKEKGRHSEEGVMVCLVQIHTQVQSLSDPMLL